MRENKNQKNSEYGQFSRSACFNFKSMLLGLWAMFDKYFVMGHLKSTFSQDSRVLTPPLLPCSPLFVFQHPPFPQGTFLLARTHPLPLNLFKLNVSFKKPHWSLYKVDTIGAWQNCPLYGDVRFVESPSKSQSNQK